MKILLTGVAGFIGFHLASELLNEGNELIGIDNLNDYYDPSLKNLRLNILKDHPQASNFLFLKGDIADREFIENLFYRNSFDIVINLAAQAGVRYSLEKPHSYADSNLVGFLNILEGCRHSNIKHLIYASSSSVYGMNISQPFSTDDRVDFPISLYAATKKSNELMAHAYSHLYQIPTTGLRFFTVYGPYGRPDMAYFKFTKAIFEGKAIDVYNNGVMERDFTYIDDICDGIIKSMKTIPKPECNKYSAASPPYKIYNIGNNKPVTLKRFIEVIEKSSGKIAIKNFLPMQKGDVPSTFADIDDFKSNCNFSPSTSIEDGIDKFVNWYITYNNNTL